MKLTKAFAQYGATLKNVQWAVSAIADGKLVLSCWLHYFQRMTYTDSLSRFGGPGNNLLREQIERAYKERMPVKAVIAIAEDRRAVDSGADASTMRKKFTVKPDRTGKVTSFDGDEFQIEFSVDRVGPKVSVANG